MDRRRQWRSDPKAGWEAHRRERLTIGLGATPAQRLAWLERAIALAHLTGALPRQDADRG
ncbi:MAG TPA: hypothetical protein VF029_07100 [Actinomycetota bacterium]